MARVPYVDKEQLPAEDRDLIESHAVRPGEPLHVRQALANNLSLLRAHHDYGSRIRNDTGLSLRERELVILTVAFQTRSRYVWQQHVTFAYDETVSEAELRALTEGAYDEFGDETVLLEYTESFLDRSVDDETHERLSDAYTDAQIVGIGLLITYYSGLSQLDDALALDIEHDQFVGWDLSGR